MQIQTGSQWISICGRVQIDPYLSPYIKTKSKKPEKDQDYPNWKEKCQGITIQSRYRSIQVLS